MFCVRQGWRPGRLLKLAHPGRTPTLLLPQEECQGYRRSPHPPKLHGLGKEVRKGAAGGRRPQHQPQRALPQPRGRGPRPGSKAQSGLREDLEGPPPRGLLTCSHPAADTAGLSWAGHITRQTARPESEPEKRSFAKAARTAHDAPMHENLQTDIRRLRSRHSLASRRTARAQVCRHAPEAPLLPLVRTRIPPPHSSTVASKGGAEQGKMARPIQVPRQLP